MSIGQHISSNADKTLDITIAASKGVTYGGAGTTGVSFAAAKTDAITFLSLEGPEILNACAIFGAIVALIGWLTNVYFQYRRDKRDEAHKAELLDIERQKLGLANE